MTARAAAIIQARMTSTRLLGKVLLPLAKHPVLWHAVEKARRIPDILSINAQVAETALENRPGLSG